MRIPIRFITVLLSIYAGCVVGRCEVVNGHFVRYGPLFKMQNADALDDLVKMFISKTLYYYIDKIFKMILCKYKYILCCCMQCYMKFDVIQTSFYLFYS